MSRLALRLLLTALAVAVPAAAGADSFQQPNDALLLDVPYLSQTSLLCGGAATAMVLRYWGARDVFPEDFALLVDASAGGIGTTALIGAVDRRGWQPVTRTPGTALPYDWLRRQVDRGRPVIALIAVSDTLFHYVVIVGVTPDEVVFHDPARAPFQTMRRDTFDVAWARAERWAMVILPPDGGSVVTATALPSSHLFDSSEADQECATRVSTGVEIARAGRLGDAELAFLAAASSCPGLSAVWTELAGLRFVQQRYAESADLARRAVTIAPRDTHAWQTLATALYVQGDEQAALDAWNHIGQPTTDLVAVEGTTRLDHPAVVSLLGLRPRQLLTRHVFERTERRLDALPSASLTTLVYRPQPDGSATVHAIVAERPLLPRGIIGWGLVGVHAALRREARLPISSPFRQGDIWDVRYRWDENRPRLRLDVAVPAPGPLPGIVGFEAFWERQTYADPTELVREERRRLSLSLSDWASNRLRWQAGGAAERIGADRFAAVEGRVETRWFEDHVAVGTAVGHWIPLSSARSFGSGAVQVAWRSDRRPHTPVWSVRAGGAAVSDGAPFAFWPVAGSSDSRGALLRGHRLLSGGIIVSEVLGRRLAHATFEHQRPVYRHGTSSVAVAGFVDVARAWADRRPATSRRDADVDVGAGLRITAPGIDGTLRLDVGYGLRDGRTRVSAGFIPAWGR